MVGQIKGNIQSLIKYQANDEKEAEQNYLKTYTHMHQQYRQCDKCQEYNGKINQLNCRIQELEESVAKVSQENIVYLEEINLKDDKLKKNTKNMMKMETELRGKVIQLEQEILKKDQNIKQIKK